MNTATNTTNNSKRFADCALIEIIHLHDCLRGALVQIQTDVQTLVDSSQNIIILTNNNISVSDNVSDNNNNNHSKFDVDKAADLSNSVASRFHLIFSVFQAHSAAEDEFIWPALNMKIESKKVSGNGNNNTSNTSSANISSNYKCGCESQMIEQDEYQEDHAIEENMFKQIHTTLRRLNGSFRYYHYHRDNKNTNNNSNATTTNNNSSSDTNNNTDEVSCLTIIRNVILQLKEQTDTLSQHLLTHLQKEETQCLPMVQRHLSKDEISTLVGKIMGQRSAEIMAKILNLAVCSLPIDERQDMVDHMVKAMKGTFFEKWLTTGGWLDDISSHNNNTNSANTSSANATSTSLKRTREETNHYESFDNKKIARHHHHDSRLRYPSKYYSYVKKNDTNIISMLWDSR